MEAECSDDVMKLRVKFNATFSGLVYSAGKHKTNKLCYNESKYSYSRSITRAKVKVFD